MRYLTLTLVLSLPACNVPADKCTHKNADGSYSIELGCGTDPDTGSATVDSTETGDSTTHTGDSDTNETGETGETGDSDTGVTPADVDGDGYIAASDGGDDCDDSDSSIHPDAEELCNGVDDDCSGTVDDGIEFVDYYVDGDGDGYGAGSATSECEDPGEGFSTRDDDCDDLDATVHPYATESCTDAVDLNCDGSAGASDLDGDGTIACEDCDDLDASAYPGNTEVCDGVDNDCEGTTDEDAADALTWYADADGDSFGDASTTSTVCDAPYGYVSDDTDCNDTDSTVNPGEAEVCDGVDNDCTGGADDGLSWTSSNRDSDGDTYGDPAVTTATCDGSAPAGYVFDVTDCDDMDASVNPGAAEYCNGMDDDCDGEQDEDSSLDAGVWYVDSDVDGYGDDGSAYVSCESGGGSSVGGDCDDGVFGVNPGAIEACDDIDNDCDGAIDESGATGETTWYADLDVDGYGDASDSVVSCEWSPDHSCSVAGDCDDSDASVYPGATETIGDGVDQDCDGSDLTDPDVDGDGYDSTGAGGTDCDDLDASAYPGNTEVCDGVDNDCDGDTDEFVATTYYPDADADGYGTTSGSVEDCSLPAGYSSVSTDCDDTDSTVNPGEAEVCDGVDNDCNGSVDEGVGGTYYEDADGDGYGNVASTITSCSALAGYVADDTDCDDSDSTVNPGEVETIGDGIDSDCDSGTDVTVVDDDFGAGTGTCSEDSWIRSDGNSITAAGDCALYIMAGGTTTSPASVTLQRPLSGLSTTTEYTFAFEVHGLSGTTVVAEVGGSYTAMAVSAGTTDTLSVTWTPTSTTETVNLWLTSSSFYDAKLVSFVVAH